MATVADKLEAACLCDEFGKEMICTSPEWATCPDGHGKLRPADPVKAALKRRRQRQHEEAVNRWLAPLGFVTQQKRPKDQVYPAFLAADGQMFARLSDRIRTFDSPPKGATLFRLKERVHAFVPYEQAELRSDDIWMPKKKVATPEGSPHAS